MSAELLVAWGDVVTLTLSNPGRANSVTPALVTDMARAFRRADQDDAVRAVILTGEGRFFCAGADLADMREIFASRGIDAAVDYMVEVWMPSVQRASLAIRNCSKLTVAAVNGAATAGGLDFALACDYTLAVPEAKVGESYVNLGLLPVAAGVEHLLRRLPPGLARRVLLGGKVATAAELGLFDQLVEPGELMQAARDLAAELTAAPRATRQQYAAAFRLADSGYEQQLAHALHANAMLLQDSDVRVRLAQILADDPGAAGRDDTGRSSR